jgi:hypothetical protein
MNSRGRRRNGRVTTHAHIYAAILALPAGVILLACALVNAFRYTPYGDPGALTAAVTLGILGVLLTGIPLLTAALVAGWAVTRDYRAWKRTLTPAQRTLLTWSELAGLTVAHIAWRDRNRREDERLTASVMGDVPPVSPFGQAAEQKASPLG